MLHFQCFVGSFQGWGEKKYKNERITAKEGEEKEVSLREGASACSRNTTTFFFLMYLTFSVSLSVSLEEKRLNERSSRVCYW